MEPTFGSSPLAEALTWPKERGRLSIRIITVPFEAHMALVHGDKMGLYQMIAKNVAARRAKGKFLLFTNVDILFNDELIQNLVKENLAPKVLYRIDRTDVRNEIPLGQGIATMLAWAKCHQLRHNRPASTIRVHPDGKPKWEKVIDPRIGPLLDFPNAMRSRVSFRICSLWLGFKSMKRSRLWWWNWNLWCLTSPGPSLWILR